MKIEDYREITEAINVALKEDKTVEVKFEGDNLTVVTYKSPKRRKTASVKLNNKG